MQLYKYTYLTALLSLHYICLAPIEEIKIGKHTLIIKCEDAAILKQLKDLNIQNTFSNDHGTNTAIHDALQGKPYSPRLTSAEQRHYNLTMDALEHLPSATSSTKKGDVLWRTTDDNNRIYAYAAKRRLYDMRHTTAHTCTLTLGNTNGIQTISIEWQRDEHPKWPWAAAAIVGVSIGCIGLYTWYTTQKKKASSLVRKT